MTLDVGTGELTRLVDDQVKKDPTDLTPYEMNELLDMFKPDERTVIESLKEYADLDKQIKDAESNVDDMKRNRVILKSIVLQKMANEDVNSVDIQGRNWFRKTMNTATATCPKDQLLEWVKAEGYGGKISITVSRSLNGIAQDLIKMHGKDYLPDFITVGSFDDLGSNASKKRNGKS